MNNISILAAEALNLINTAKWHKENCHDANCNVSLTQLKWTINRLTTSIHDPNEIDIIENAIEGIEWI